jgi:mycothiol synthase
MTGAPRAVEVRVLMPSDSEGLAAEIRRAGTAGELRASSDVKGTFVMQSFAVDPSLFGGAFDGGDLVGFVSSELKAISVRPDRRRRRIGTALVDLGVEMERRRGRPNLLLGVEPGDDAGVAFLRATGFTFHSTLWDLDLPVDRVVPEPVWSADYVARTFDRTRDVAPWTELFNAAFADHPTPLQLDASFVAAGLDDPSILDSDTLIVEESASGDLVGFCALDVRRNDGVPAGDADIWTIGVRPDRQGHGLGRQLLRFAVSTLRRMGVGSISLSVNGRNDGALRLYESEGFVRVRSRDRWAKSVASS